MYKIGPMHESVKGISMLDFSFLQNYDMTMLSSTPSSRAWKRVRSEKSTQSSRNGIEMYQQMT